MHSAPTRREVGAIEHVVEHCGIPARRSDDSPSLVWAGEAGIANRGNDASGGKSVQFWVVGPAALEMPTMAERLHLVCVLV